MITDLLAISPLCFSLFDSSHLSSYCYIAMLLSSSLHNLISSCIIVIFHVLEQPSELVKVMCALSLLTCILINLVVHIPLILYRSLYISFLNHL